MPYNPNIHHRRSVRLKEYDYSQEGLYFVTICVKNGEYLFGNIIDGEMVLNEYGKIVEKCWLEITQHYPDTILHEFVVMPNHLHGIIEITVGANNYSPNYSPKCLKNDNGANDDSPLQRPNGTSRTIGAIVRGFKIGVTKQFGYSAWQRSFHEHIIRNRNAHARIAEYIVNNPKIWETDRFYTK